MPMLDSRLQRPVRHRTFNVMYVPEQRSFRYCMSYCNYFRMVRFSNLQRAFLLLKKPLVSSQVSRTRVNLLTEKRLDLLIIGLFRMLEDKGIPGEVPDDDSFMSNMLLFTDYYTAAVITFFAISVTFLIWDIRNSD